MFFESIVIFFNFTVCGFFFFFTFCSEIPELDSASSVSSWRDGQNELVVLQDFNGPKKTFYFYLSVCSEASKSSVNSEVGGSVFVRNYKLNRSRKFIFCAA